MTNKEAINILKRGYPDSNRYAASELEVYEYDVETYNEAVEYAIKALERDGWLDYDECGTTCLSCPVCGAVWKRK